MDIKRTDTAQRKRRKSLQVGALVLGLVAAVTGVVYSFEPAAPAVARSQLWIDQVRQGEMLRQVRGSGVLVPKELRWIAAQSPGRIERILVKPGARVSADDVLLELSNPDLLQAADDAQWAVTAARAQLASTQVELDNQLLDREANLATAEAQYESARLQAEAEADLADRGIIPQIQSRQSQLDANQLHTRMQIEGQRFEKFKLLVTARMEAEQARFKQLENTFSRRRDQVANLQLRAGIDGVLQQVVVEEGQQLVVGASVGKVARPGELLAELRVPEINARHIQLDQLVVVDTRNGKVDGQVIRIDPAVQNGTVQVDVVLTGDLPAGARPDLTVDGVIEIERLTNVLHMGRPAYSESNSELRLFRLLDSGVAQRVPVRLGRTSVNQIEILGGLAVGDEVILSDVSTWDRYDRLTIK